MHTIGEKRIRMLKPRDIKKPQIKLRNDFDETELLLLRDSIAAGGILQPLLVRKVNRGTYQLIAGERRLRAALMAGLRRVPCVVHNVNDNTALIYSLTENLQSKNISFFDEARALNLLINKNGVTLSETAARLGISQTTLASKLQVLRLDERLAKRIEAANLSEAHARALLRLPKEGRPQALDKIIADSLNLKQTEEYIFSILNPPLDTACETKIQSEPQEKGTVKISIGDPRLFSNSLSKLVETLKSGGVGVSYKKSENEKYIEYKIRIKKENTDTQNLQLKLCQ